VPSPELSEGVDSIYTILRENLENMDSDALSHTEAGIIYSVSGYVTRYIHCDCVPCAMAHEITTDRTHFEAMSRGGWVTPNANILFFCTVATTAFNILVLPPYKNTFLSVKFHRSIFVKALIKVLHEFIPILRNCHHIHHSLTIYFNILAKNFLRKENDSVLQNTCFRKIHKLLSRSSLS